MIAPKSSLPPRSSSSGGPRPLPAFDLRQPLIVLRSHLWITLALVLVSCTLLAWQQARQPRLFAATATLFFEREEQRPQAVQVDEYTDNELTIATRLEQLRTFEMLRRVVTSLSVEERAVVAAGYPGTLAGGDSGLEKVVRGSVSFARKEGTTLIAINAVHRDPNAAALLANRYAEQAVRHVAERGRASSNASLVFLREQAEEMRKKTESAERALQEYRQRYNLVSLEDNQNIIVDNLKSLNASATAARVARFSADARLEQAEAVIGRGDDAAQLAAITDSESLGNVARKLADLRGKRTVMAERYGRRHPSMQENERAIAALEKLRTDEVRTVLTNLRDRRDKAVAEERHLAEMLKKAEKEALDLDQLGVEYNILRRTVESYKTTYSQILTRLNDATISSQLRGVNMKVSELAAAPQAPFSPNPRKTILVTAALGLAIFLLYPFSAEMFFGRIRSAVDVEHHLDVPLLGEIGSVRKIRERDRPLLVHGASDETAVEQFRGLFSQLILTSKIDPPKAILVTSTLQGEGKSFIAGNLAQCFVAHGRRTLLIDADLRRPTQHRNFGVDNKAGMIRWIEEGGRLDDDLLHDEKLGLIEVLPGLFLLRAGGVTRKATELLETGRLPVLFAALQRHFDVMIFDTPPAGVFSDAVAFARVCHELVYICRFNAVSRQAVREVLERLRHTELEFTGVVLNAMPAGFGGNYYYKHSSYQRSKSYAPQRVVEKT
jgi:polysaccharide biosynthesis transport protein